MHSTTDINAVINQAKQNRADYIAATVQRGIVPVALATLVSLALVALSGEPSQEQAQPNPAVETSTQLG